MYELNKYGSAFCVLDGKTNGVIVLKKGNLTCVTCSSVSCRHMKVVQKINTENRWDEVPPSFRVFFNQSEQPYQPRHENPAAKVLSTSKIPHTFNTHMSEVYNLSVEERCGADKTLSPRAIESGCCSTCNSAVETIPHYGHLVPLVDTKDIKMVKGKIIYFMNSWRSARRILN